MIFEKHKIDAECPCCKRWIWIGFVKGYFCQNCQNYNTKQKQQMDKTLPRQDKIFSINLPQANEKI